MKEKVRKLRVTANKIGKEAVHQMKQMFGPVTPSISEEDAEQFNTRSFGGLKNRTIYWDPCNWMQKGHINLRKDLYERALPGLEAVDAAQHLGLQAQFDAFHSTMRKKALLSSTWNIPIHAVPEVNIVYPGILPMANLLARMTFNKDTLQETPLTTVGDAAHFAEAATAYTENDDTYHDGTLALYTYATDSYGRANKISSLMTMVGGAIQNPRNTNAMAQLHSIRRYEEKQIIQGRNGGDASGFKGLYEFSTESSKGAFNTNKAVTGINYIDDITDGIETLISNGANPDSTMIVTDQNTHKLIVKALRDYVRTDSAYRTNKTFQITAPGIDARFRAIDFDGTPIFKSYGAKETSGSREIYFLDAGSVYMAMVQDATLRPLASTGPYEFAATDAFGMASCKARGHVGRYYGITA